MWYPPETSNLLAPRYKSSILSHCSSPKHFVHDAVLKKGAVPGVFFVFVKLNRWNVPTFSWLIFMVNVGKLVSLHGCYGVKLHFEIAVYSTKHMISLEHGMVYDHFQTHSEMSCLKCVSSFRVSHYFRGLEKTYPNYHQTKRQGLFRRVWCNMQILQDLILECPNKQVNRTQTHTECWNRFCLQLVVYIVSVSL